MLTESVLQLYRRGVRAVHSRTRKGPALRPWTPSNRRGCFTAGEFVSDAGLYSTWLHMSLRGLQVSFGIPSNCRNIYITFTCHSISVKLLWWHVQLHLRALWCIGADSETGADKPISCHIQRNQDLSMHRCVLFFESAFVYNYSAR